MPIDPNLVYGFRPTPNIGPNVGDAVQTAGQMVGFQQQRLALEQQQQAEQTQNALRGILGAPGAIDDKGQPTADAMKQVTALDPNLAMKLRQNALVQQENALRTSYMKTQDFAAKHDQIYGSYAPILETYLKNRETMPPEQAMKQAQDGLTAANTDLTQGGFLTPEEQGRLPKQFDPAQMQNFVAGSKIWQDHLKTDAGAHRQQVADNRERFPDAPKEMQYTKDGKTVSEQAVWDRDGRQWVSLQTNQPITAGDIREAPKKEFDKTQNFIGFDADGYPTTVTASLRTSDRKWIGEDGNVLDVSKLHPGTGAGGGVSALTHDAIDNQALSYISTGNTDIGGFGGLIDKETIQNRAAILLKQMGLTQYDVGSNRAQQKANSASLSGLQKQADAAQAFSETAKKEMDMAVKSIPKSAEPLNSQLLTQWVRTGETQFGDTEVPVYQAYLISALEEYAKVMSGSTGAQGSTDAARRLALQMVPDGATSEQIPKIVDALKKGMDNRTAGYGGQLQTIRDRIAGRSGNATGDQGGQGGQGGGTTTGGTANQPAAKTDQGGAAGSGVPDWIKAKPGWQWNPDRKMGRDPSGNLYDANGKPVTAGQQGAQPATATPAKANATGRTAQDAVPVTTPAEAMKLPPGTYFIGPDKKLRRRPEAAPATVATN